MGVRKGINHAGPVRARARARTFAYTFCCINFLAASRRSRFLRASLLRDDQRAELASSSASCRVVASAWNFQASCLYRPIFSGIKRAYRASSGTNKSQRFAPSGFTDAKRKMLSRTFVYSKIREALALDAPECTRDATARYGKERQGRREGERYRLNARAYLPHASPSSCIGRPNSPICHASYSAPSFHCCTHQGANIGRITDLTWKARRMQGVAFLRGMFID